MAEKRKTIRQLRSERQTALRAEMQVALDEGRLKIRQMTPKERRAAEAQRAAGDERRALRSAGRRR